MTTEENKAELRRLTAQLEKDLLALYGPILSGEELTRALGYRSMAAFRQALHRGTVPVKVFPIENRRGKHALSKDVASWLASQRIGIN